MTVSDFPPPDISLVSSMWQTRSAGTHSRAPQPLDVRHLRHHIRRPLGLRRHWNQRDAVALAALQDPLQWLLGFPLGTSPSGRVFFWSYLFYLSRFLHMLRIVLVVLRRCKLVFFQLFYHAISAFMSFMWLEFSQSFQVLAILFTTLVFSIMHGYRFWTSATASDGSRDGAWRWQQHERHETSHAKVCDAVGYIFSRRG